MNDLKPLILTLGDPTGVGPEILVDAIRRAEAGLIRYPLVIAGDLSVLQKAARVVGADFFAEEFVDPLATHRVALDGRPVLLKALSDLHAVHLEYGKPTVDCGAAMMRYIEWACDRCLDGSAAGIVTGPINKAAAHRAGYDIPGHTEFLAERCGVGKVVMMLAGERLKVCLVTTHLALSEVPAALSKEEIVRTVEIVDRDFRQSFGRKAPRLAILSLNPHAGEEGKFGDEETTMIEPAIVDLQARGINVDGPHSADTLFHRAVQNQNYDAVICMYHDQGLIPLKLLHFEDGVNVTLGLPIVRTSVDHGTAYSRAGTGTASCRSLQEAIRWAERMADAKSCSLDLFPHTKLCKKR